MSFGYEECHCVCLIKVIIKPGTRAISVSRSWNDRAIRMWFCLIVEGHSPEFYIYRVYHNLNWIVVCTMIYYSNKHSSRQNKAENFLFSVSSFINFVENSTNLRYKNVGLINNPAHLMVFINMMKKIIFYHMYLIMKGEIWRRETRHRRRD